MDTVFEPLKRESTRDKVCTAIREAIFAGRLKVGQRLREIPLAREFAVGRAVVREALQQLAHEGMVEVNAFRGAQVVDLTPAQVDEAVGLRLMLESEAVRLARLRLSEKDKARLRKLARELEQAQEDSMSSTQLDFELHETIWKLSGNETLSKHLALLTAPLFSMGTIMRHSRMWRADRMTVDYRRGKHTRLVEALCEGTPDEAVEAVRDHITENWVKTRAAIEKLRQTGKPTGRRKPAKAKS